MPSTILLFALAKEKAGASSLSVQLAPGSSVLDLKAALARACPALAPLLATLRISINSEYSIDDRQIIPPDAELAAIPPVSGGSTFHPHRP